MRLMTHYLSRYKKAIIFPTVALFLAVWIDAIIPIFQQQFIDEILFNPNVSSVLSFIGMLLVLMVFRSIFGYIREYGFDKLSVSIVGELRHDLFETIQSMPFSFFDKESTGELMSRIGEDVDMVWETIGYGLRLLIEIILLFILCSFFMFRMNMLLATICLVILIPVSFLSLYFQKKFWTVYEDIGEKTATLNSVTQQNIAGIRLVKAFAREKHETMKFLETNTALVDAKLYRNKLLSQFIPTIDFFCNLTNVALIVFGGILCIQGHITFGVLSAFSIYILTLAWCVRSIGSFITLLSQNQASMNRIFKVLDLKSNLTSPDNGYAPDTFKGEIVFDNVSFKYGDELVLNQINLTIPAGSSLAIMGPTGCGKSTLLAMIGRYYDVTEGAVLVDGVNVKEWDLVCLRSNLNMIFQDTFLFSDSIKNNIDFGECHTLKEVRRAAKTSCAHDFIEDLEEGYDTVIGERGVGLSGGQKQRLTIARALLQTPKILCLDDATSALDMETEYTVLHNLSTDMPSATTLIVAHRISGVKDANQIIYMESGMIMESGTHHSLLEQKGHYYAIYCDQFKEFIDLEKEV